MGAERNLVENHLHFLARHRSEIRRLPGAIEAISPSPAFNFALVERTAGNEPLVARHRTVRLLPWGELSPAELEARRLVRQGGFDYMLLEGDLRARAPRTELEIEEVNDEAAMARFTNVQSRGFLGPDDSLEKLAAFLGGANLRNLGQPDQIFCVGHLDGRPAGVILLVLAAGIAGIYAVATVPEARSRGVSTALLVHALARARERGFAVAGLQAVEGSYASSFYARRGFRSAFISPTFVRRG